MIILHESIQVLNRESSKLKSILAKNEYPEYIVNKEFEKFLNSKNSVNINEEIRVKTTESEQTKRFNVLLFRNKKEAEFRRMLKYTVGSNYPQVEFNVAF